ncbi:MAG: YciI family protein [Candidatus Bipolaricaulota bacterium]|nr:YciI family protein [Candidatus Bipolaricaulota bacterium]
MPQFLYRVQPARPEFFGGPTADEEAAVGEHFADLEDLTRRRVVLLAGRTLNEDPSTFGIVIFEASSDAAARDLLARDPAVRAGVFLAELFPYRIALASPHLLDLAPPQDPQSESQS